MSMQSKGTHALDGELMNILSAPSIYGSRSRFLGGALLVLGTFGPLMTGAEEPPRFYWKSLAGASAVPLIVTSMSGNTNPFDPAHTVTAGANFDATLAIVGFAHTFALFDRSATAAVLLPMGRISGEVTRGVTTVNESTSGFSDPMVELDLNLLGPPAQKNLQDAMRYEPGFSVDLLVDLALPIGEYDNSTPLNVGQNRWYGRVGFPVVWQLGPWVPGRRTTLEFVPAVWVFGTNEDYVGAELKTDPLIQFDAHLTRDFTERLWGSLDAAWYYGGKASVDGVDGDKLNNVGLGLTLGYQINENVNFTFSYKSTVNDQAPGDLQMDVFMISLVSGWHPLIEGVRRLNNE
jgi:hypothetical protein